MWRGESEESDNFRRMLWGACFWVLRRLGIRRRWACMFGCFRLSPMLILSMAPFSGEVHVNPIPFINHLKDISRNQSLDEAIVFQQHQDFAAEQNKTPNPGPGAAFPIFSVSI